MENERRVIELIRKSSNQDEAIKVALEILTMLLEARGILKKQCAGTVRAVPVHFLAHLNTLLNT